MAPYVQHVVFVSPAYQGLIGRFGIHIRRFASHEVEINSASFLAFFLKEQRLLYIFAGQRRKEFLR